MSMKNSSYTIWDRTSDLPICSAAPFDCMAASFVILIGVSSLTSDHNFYVCHPVVLTAIMKECFQKKVHNIH